MVASAAGMSLCASAAKWPRWPLLDGNAAATAAVGSSGRYCWATAQRSTAERRPLRRRAVSALVAHSGVNTARMSPAVTSATDLAPRMGST